MRHWICLAVSLCGVGFGIWGVEKYRAAVGIVESQAVMMRTPFWCPESSYVQYSDWGEGNVAKNCFLLSDSKESRMMKNGPWEGWKDRRILAKGTFSHGNKHGNFYLYHEDGEVRCKIKYELGSRVSDSGDCSRW